MKTMTFNGNTDTYMTAAEVTRTYPLIPYTLLKRLRDSGYGPAYLSVGTRTYYSVTAIESYFNNCVVNSPGLPNRVAAGDVSETEEDHLTAVVEEALAHGMLLGPASLKVNGQTVELSEQGQSYLDAAANILGAFEFEVTDEEQ